MSNRTKVFRRLLVTHNDLDGLSSCFVAQLLNEDVGIDKSLKFDKIIVAPNDFELDPYYWNRLLMFDEIIMADISVPEEIFVQLLEYNKKVYIYDHHETSLYLKDYKESGCHDLERSGAKIFYEEYIKPKLSKVPPALDRMIHLVDTYDRWQQEHTDWEEALILSRCLYRMKDYFTDTRDEQYLMRDWFAFYKRKISNIDEWRWTRKELELNKKAVEKEERAYQEAISNLQIRTDLKGNQFGLTEMSSSISLTADRLLKEYSFLQYLVIVNNYNGITGKLSLRSKKFDVLQIFPIKGHSEAGGGYIYSLNAHTLLEKQDCSLNYWSEVPKDIEDVEQELYELVFATPTIKSSGETNE